MQTGDPRMPAKPGRNHTRQWTSHVRITCAKLLWKPGLRSLCSMVYNPAKFCDRFMSYAGVRMGAFEPQVVKIAHSKKTLSRDFNLGTQLEILMNN